MRIWRWFMLLCVIITLYATCNTSAGVHVYSHHPRHNKFYHNRIQQHIARRNERHTKNIIADTAKKLPECILEDTVFKETKQRRGKRDKITHLQQISHRVEPYIKPIRDVIQQMIHDSVSISAVRALYTHIIHSRFIKQNLFALLIGRAETLLNEWMYGSLKVLETKYAQKRTNFLQSFDVEYIENQTLRTTDNDIDDILTEHAMESDEHLKAGMSFLIATQNIKQILTHWSQNMLHMLRRIASVVPRQMIRALHDILERIMPYGFAMIRQTFLMVIPSVWNGMKYAMCHENHVPYTPFAYDAVKAAHDEFEMITSKQRSIALPVRTAFRTAMHKVTVNAIQNGFNITLRKIESLFGQCIERYIVSDGNEIGWKKKILRWFKYQIIVFLRWIIEIAKHIIKVVLSQILDAMASAKHIQFNETKFDFASIEYDDTMDTEHH